MGAEVFFESLRADKIKLGENQFLQLSCFGYFISDSIFDNNINNAGKYCFLSKNLKTLNKTLMSFLEIEDVESLKTRSSDELIYCNKHFDKRRLGKRMVDI